MPGLAVRKQTNYPTQSPCRCTRWPWHSNPACLPCLFQPTVGKTPSDVLGLWGRINKHAPDKSRTGQRTLAHSDPLPSRHKPVLTNHISHKAHLSMPVNNEINRKFWSASTIPGVVSGVIVPMVPEAQEVVGEARSWWKGKGMAGFLRKKHRLLRSKTTQEVTIASLGLQTRIQSDHSTFS